MTDHTQEPLWSDTDIANDAKRASSNPTVQAAIRRCLLFMRHGYEAHIAELSAERDALRAQLEAQGSWEDVPGGEYVMREPGQDHYGYKIRVDGSLVQYIGLPHAIFLDEPFDEIELPDGWKLQRRITSGEGEQRRA